MFKLYLFLGTHNSFHSKPSYRIAPREIGAGVSFARAGSCPGFVCVGVPLHSLRCYFILKEEALLAFCTPPGRVGSSRRCGSSAAAGRAADSNLPSNLAGLADWARSPRSWSSGERRGPGRAGERAGGGRGCAWELGASARLPGGAGAGEGPRSGGNRRAAIRGCTATCHSLSTQPDESGR